MERKRGVLVKTQFFFNIFLINRGKLLFCAKKKKKKSFPVLHYGFMLCQSGRERKVEKYFYFFFLKILKKMATIFVFVLSFS